MKLIYSPTNAIAKQPNSAETPPFQNRSPWEAVGQDRPWIMPPSQPNLSILEPWGKEGNNKINFAVTKRKAISCVFLFNMKKNIGMDIS